MKNGRLIGSMVVGIGVTAVAAGLMGTAVLDKLNENEESTFKRVRNTIGYFASCCAIGFVVGTIIETNENQIRFVESILNSVSKTEA